MNIVQAAKDLTEQMGKPVEIIEIVTPQALSLIAEQASVSRKTVVGVTERCGGLAQFFDLGVVEGEEERALYNFLRAARLALIPHSQGNVPTIEHIVGMVASRIAHSEEEVCVVVCMKDRQLLAIKEIVRGNQNKVHMPLSSVFKPILRSGATAFAIAHNHPNGQVKPTPEDNELMQYTAAIAKILGLEFLDFIIITPTRFLSYACMLRDSDLFSIKVGDEPSDHIFSLVLPDEDLNLVELEAES